MTRAVSAKNQPILLRRSFPLSELGSKTGTGVLSVSAALGLTSGGVVTTPVRVKVARILTPLSKNQPQFLLSSAGEVGAPGPKTGDGALAASASISGVSAARNFYDVGTGDALTAGVTISGSEAVGVNRSGSGTLTAGPFFTASAGVNRNGTGSLARQTTLSASGSIAAPGSSTGTGALAAIGAVTGVGYRQLPATGGLTLQSTVSATGTVARTSAGGVLSVAMTIEGTGSTSVRWERIAEPASVWTIIPRTTSST